MTAQTAGTRFELPDSLSATGPPESRGLARDDVRLLVARPTGVTHARFRDLGDHLAAPDVLVVNTSATVPGALSALRPDGRAVTVHVSSPLADASYLVELRCPDGSCRVTDARAGETLHLGPGNGAGDVTLRSAYPDAQVRQGSRLWRAVFDTPVPPDELLRRHGRPIAYGYVERPWPLESYQTVFGREPGSAEMASAGRPFTDRLVVDLVTAGVQLAPVLLHTGVSSPEAGETPLPERFAVAPDAARRINEARGAGGRVVAVGTTVARAIESAARPDGDVVAAQGWTDLVLGPHRVARTVDGLVTGWHDPHASHLLLLEAVAGVPLVQAAYEAALAERYLWHEFGDSALLLPTMAR
ncbi:MAG: S-adenosylmethionine:tRNA ribosyltransferase-isomerase [Nocardioidaceae bacterium]